VRHGSIRVAIVDDEPTMRSTLEDLVTGDRRFALVGSGATADEAIELAANLDPDVILLDVMLPGGGAEAARGIRARSPRTSVVAISVHADRHTVSTMEAAGATEYLIKGTATVQDIVAAIQRAAETPEDLTLPSGER
jgi:DNA-binding NarL/FixJ family response regulator